MNTFMFWTLKSIRTYNYRHYYYDASTGSETFDETKAIAFHHKKNAKKFLKENNLYEKYCTVIVEFETETDKAPNYFDKQ